MRTMKLDVSKREMEFERLIEDRIYYKKMYKYTEISLWFMVILLIGGLMNFLVISKNGGRMPVLNYNIHNDEYFGYNEYEKDKIEYEIFGDRINIFGRCIASIGDILMIIGAIGVLYGNANMVLNLRKRKKWN